MTTKFNRKPRAMRITREANGMHVLVTGTDALSQEMPPHEYTETTKTLNELVDYYVESFPLVTEVNIRVAIVPPAQRAGRVTPP